MIGLILENLLPLYGLILLGYIAGKKLDVNLNSISRIAIFILLPIVTLGATIQLELNPSYIFLPFVIWTISYIVALSTYKVAGLHWKDGTQNLLATAGVNSNAIYFGLPVIIALFGPVGTAIYLVMNLGGSINNVTLGYYLTARGRFTVKESFIKVLKFPAVHAAWVGLVLNVAGIEMTNVMDRYWDFAKGGMVFLGMMMIGIAISKLPRLSFNWLEISAYMFVKSVAWPVLAASVVALDICVFKLYGSEVHQMLLYHSAMPIMGNLVAYAAEHKLHPERAGAAVMFSSVAALATIPGMYLLIQYFGI